MLISECIKKIDDEFLSFCLLKDANFEAFAKATDVRKSESIVFFDEDFIRGRYKFLDSVIQNKFNNISAIILTNAHLDYIKNKCELDDRIGILICDYPRYAFFVIREMIIASDDRYKANHTFTKINKLSHIGNNVRVGEKINVGSSTVINDNTIIEDGVSIGDN